MRDMHRSAERGGWVVGRRPSPTAYRLPCRLRGSVRRTKRQRTAEKGRGDQEERARTYNQHNKTTLRGMEQWHTQSKASKQQVSEQGHDGGACGGGI